jgi:hypothetical protein
MTETAPRFMLILVPVKDTHPAEPGRLGTPERGKWVWLASREDWDIGPFEVAGEWPAPGTVPHEWEPRIVLGGGQCTRCGQLYGLDGTEDAKARYAPCPRGAEPLT